MSNGKVQNEKSIAFLYKRCMYLLQTVASSSSDFVVSFICKKWFSLSFSCVFLLTRCRLFPVQHSHYYRYARGFKNKIWPPAPRILILYLSYQGFSIASWSIFSFFSLVLKSLYTWLITNLFLKCSMIFTDIAYLVLCLVRINWFWQISTDSRVIRSFIALHDS